ncbi:hypothetical protein N9J83_09435, partial [Opitutales bacterium]|nr:hypothetical protein [Opitutales bacterium]
HPEAEFYIKYFTNRLTNEEKKSKLFLESSIQSALFGVSPKADLSLTYLSNLPNDLSTSPKYQVYTAFAHLLRGNQESAISLLKTLCDSNPNSSDTWIETARSLSDGTEFEGSRKALFLEQLEKLYEHWQKDADAFLIEGAWLHPNEKLDKKRMVFHFAGNEALPFLYFCLLRFENLKSVSHWDATMHLQSKRHMVFTTSFFRPWNRLYPESN